MCPPFIGMEGRNGMANTVKKEGRDGGHAVKSGWYPSLPIIKWAILGPTHCRYRYSVITFTFRIRVSLDWRRGKERCRLSSFLSTTPGEVSSLSRVANYTPGIFR